MANAGAGLRRAGTAALGNGDSAIADFLDGGFTSAVDEDLRVATATAMSTGGKPVAEAADAALGDFDGGGPTVRGQVGGGVLAGLLGFMPARPSRSQAQRRPCPYPQRRGETGPGHTPTALRDLLSGPGGF